MGVTGLWKLVEPCGKNVPVETLEGKILAVDISIWLHQVVKGFQDNKGNALPNAHLLGLFNRLCKLLYYRVKPVFVFDGGVPQLKRDTIIRRQQQRGKLNSEADRIENLIVRALAREKVVQQALGGNVDELLRQSPTKRSTKRTDEDAAIDDLFKLPDVGESAANGNIEQQKDLDYSSTAFSDSYDLDGPDGTDTDLTSSFEEHNSRYAYDTNLQAIDVRSKHFRELPAEVRHEILVDIKETRKHSWGRLHELPACSNQFSQFQMKRLLKRRAVQESLEEVEVELGGRTLGYSELLNYFTEEGVLEKSAMDSVSKPICSDENTRFLLVRDLKKKLEADSEKSVEKNNVTITSTVATSMRITTEIKPDNEVTEQNDNEEEKEDRTTKRNEGTDLGKEYDIDLQIALAMSTEDSPAVYSNEDFEYANDLQLRLNANQRRHLNHAAKGPARAYMIEYGGMNDEEVNGIMEETQVIHDVTLNQILQIVDEDMNQDVKASKEVDLKQSDEDKNEKYNKDVKEDEDARNKTATASITAAVTNTYESIEVSDSDTDSDLEEVPIDNLDSEQMSQRTTKASMEIILDLKEPLEPQDDLFDDIFNNAGEEKGEPIKSCLALPHNVKSEDVMHEANHELIEEKSIKKTEIANILHELKRQSDATSKIQLEDIKVSNSIIVLSDNDDEDGAKASFSKDDVISTPFTTPLKKKNSMSATKSSPHTESPSNKKITQYFEVNSITKRTPDKKKVMEDEEIVSKVKSPFFIKKTPSSNRRNSSSTSSSPSTSAGCSAKRSSNVSKMLFNDNAKNQEVGDSNTQKSQTIEEMIEDSANALKAQKSSTELTTMANELAQERRQLETERNRQDRMGTTISERMSMECQELLRLFGIPYIVAPMEAEAQCAFLDSNQLTDGTITDDSDIWLFGGRTVYKNFFATNKNVLEFKADSIEQLLKCDRKRLIQLACLVGSDYTSGVHGIGIVTALEILASFSSKEPTAAAEGKANISSSMTALATLSRFRDWWRQINAAASPIGSSVRLALRKKLKNIELDDNFPSLSVIQAYLMPKVDDNKGAFSWGFPDLQSIREFTKKTFGWTTTKTDETLQPVLKKLNEKKTQATIKNYFAVKSTLFNQQLKVSKRVQTAVTQLSTDQQGADETEVTDKSNKDATVKSKCKKRTSKRKLPSVSSSTPSTNNDIKTTVITKQAISPTTNSDVIPQRESDRRAMEANKKLAAEVFKNAKLNKKKK